jgi:toxin secretion/phage lysis holin
VERWDLVYKGFVTGGGALIGYLYGGESPLLNLLLAFVAFDYLSACIAAVYVDGWKALSSKIGFKGIAKKIMIFALVAVAHLVDSALGENHIFRDATIFFYIANEFISILENAAKMNLAVPDKLKEAIQVLKGKGGNNELDK